MQVRTSNRAGSMIFSCGLAISCAASVPRWANRYLMSSANSGSRPAISQRLKMLTQMLLTPLALLLVTCAPMHAISAWTLTVLLQPFVTKAGLRRRMGCLTRLRLFEKKHSPKSKANVQIETRCLTGQPLLHQGLNRYSLALSREPWARFSFWLLWSGRLALAAGRFSTRCSAFSFRL